MKHLSNEEREHLETLCWARTVTHSRDAALILLALSTGARATELLNLSWDDINLTNGSVRIKTLKRGKNRELPISKRLVTILTALKAVSNIRPFNIGYQRLVQIWNLWRPCQVSFHALRHTFAMGLYNRKKDINLVKYCLGHRSLSSTTVYLEEQYSINSLKHSMGVR